MSLKYTVHYEHKTKEVTLELLVGLSPPVKFLMSAEAFVQDIDWLKVNKQFLGFIAFVRAKKDLPIDYVETDGSPIKFDPSEWEGRMGGE